MRALPFFLILLIAALALWIVQSGDDGSTASLSRSGDAASSGADAAALEGAGVRTSSTAGGAAGQASEGARTGAREEFLLRVHTVGARGQDIAGARISFALVRGGEEHAQRVLGVTAADGRLECPVEAFDLIAPALVRETSWRIEAWAPGHLPGGASGPVERERRLAVQVQLSPGATLRGRVVDSAGLPVVGALASAQAQTSAGGLQQPLAEGHPTDAEGRFALAAQPGKRGAIIALDTARGAGSLHPFDIGHDADVGDIVLDPLGTLAGRVAYTDGSPARHVRVSATFQVIDRAATSDVQRVQRDAHRRRVFESVANGCFSAWAHTDDDGRFRIAGLFPGRYEVKPQTWAAPFGVDAYDPALVFTTPSDSIELSIDVTRLVVELRGPGGEPLTGLEVVCRLLDEAREPVDDAELGASWSELASGPAARAGFIVEGGRRYVLAVNGHGTFAVEEELLVPAGPEHLHVITLPDSGAVGELVVDLRDSSGRLWNDWRATLRGRRLGRVVRGFEQRAPEEDGVLRGVPAGDWTVEISAHGTAAERSFLWLPEPRVDTTIVPGQRRALALTAAQGARVSVALDGSELANPSPPADDPARNAQRLQAQGVWIWLEPASGAARIQVPCLDARVSPEPTPRTLPGCTAEGLGAVPPGDYTLVISGPGIRQHMEKLVLSAGQVTERRVLLQER